MCHPSVLLWHTDNSELQALEKQQAQENSGLPSVSSKQMKFSRAKCPASTRRKGSCLIKRGLAKPREIYTDKPPLTNSFFLAPSPLRLLPAKPFASPCFSVLLFSHSVTAVCIFGVLQKPTDYQRLCPQGDAVEGDDTAESWGLMGGL